MLSCQLSRVAVDADRWRAVRIAGPSLHAGAACTTCTMRMPCDRLALTCIPGACVREGARDVNAHFEACLCEVSRAARRLVARASSGLVLSSCKNGGSSCNQVTPAYSQQPAASSQIWPWLRPAALIIARLKCGEKGANEFRLCSWLLDPDPWRPPRRRGARTSPCHPPPPPAARR